MLLGIAHGHLGPQDRQVAILGHLVATETNTRDDGPHLRGLEFLAQILDQVDQVLLVLLLCLPLILVSLEPGEPDDLVALAFVVRHDILDIGERAVNALHHSVILVATEMVGLLFFGLAAGRRTEIEVQRAVAHRGFDQQYRFLMIGAHHVAKGDLGADELAVGGGGQGATRTAFNLGAASFPVGHVVAHGPLAFLVNKPGILAGLGEGRQVALALEFNLLEPERSRAALHVGNGERVALALLKSNGCHNRVGLEISTVDLLAGDGSDGIRAIFKARVNLEGPAHRHIDRRLGHNRVWSLECRQLGLHRTQGNGAFLGRLHGRVVGIRFVGARVDGNLRASGGGGGLGLINTVGQKR